MGADFFLAGVPVIEVTADRVKELQTIIDQLTDDHFTKTEPPDAIDLAEWQRQLREAVTMLDSIDDLRDVGQWNGWWVSGGMCWDGYPTDSYASLALIHACDPLLDRLLSWSREDAGSSNEAGIGMPSTRPSEDDRAVFALYDIDLGTLASTRVFCSYSEATDEIDARQTDVMVVRIGPA